ncbi:helix-turn-helix domain-containing protein [Mesorhizobium sp. SP-1A]|uniref:helix-turn-helix domain-containing protein n=1 Tax=Mesorhizobium sp. SP-1A TaxID=3077840 RepID=UPI0028F6C491|nr:helix-turn-helix domain-containing protein [Mesorhizobium sp. SP-1A]
MDSLITAAAQALAAGDPFGALNRIALREDAPALALRGIAMAQLGDLVRAKALLKRAARAFGQGEPVARARCVVAEAEIALVSRDLSWPVKALDTARQTLEKHGDRINAAYACQLEARRLLLVGRADDAERVLGKAEASSLPPALRAAHELAAAGIAIRRLQIKAARASLKLAVRAAETANIPAQKAEVERVAQTLAAPAAQLVAKGAARPLLLDEVEKLMASEVFVVDACRNVVHVRHCFLSLATRPVLFALLQALAESWPGDTTREELIARAFRGKSADESHRARLRVEMGRLRDELRSIAGISATENGFALSPHEAADVVVLAPPVEERHAAVLALLADGEVWSSSALAIALGTSARTVQRALEQLASAGKIESFGRGRARRWTTPPVPGFPTSLLLPGALPGR